jgi:hypothetical protein
MMAGSAADLSAGRMAQLTGEVAWLRGELAARDRRIAELDGALHNMQRRMDDLLDRESMHVYDADMERLTTAAGIDRLGTARARHAVGAFSEIEEHHGRSPWSSRPGGVQDVGSAARHRTRHQDFLRGPRRLASGLKRLRIAVGEHPPQIRCQSSVLGSTPH